MKFPMWRRGANEANYVEKTQKQPDASSGDLFGLEDLIFKSSKKCTKVAQETNSSEPKFPPGFTPLTLHHSENVATKETKMVSFDVFVDRAFWDNMLFDFATSSARGRSGGILCVWDKLLFQKKRTFSTDYCLYVKGTWFIANSHLIDIPLGGYSFTWSDKHTRKGPPDDVPTRSRSFMICRKEDILYKKRRHIVIKGVLIDGEWIENPSWVKTKFYNHYANRFSAPDWTRTPFEGQFPNLLDIEQSCDLEIEVTNEEIKRAVWDCGSYKSPGPNGFTFEFFKMFWSIVGGEVINVVKEFFSSSTLPNGCNPLFLDLIPKVLDAKHLNEFQPISDIISQEQSAFIKGRQIMDGPLILNELISWCTSEKEQSLMFKVDFQKVFNSVRWDHVDDILGKEILYPLFFSSSSWKVFMFLFEDLLIECHDVNASLFFLASGLKVNVHKSSLYGVGVRLSEIHHMASRFGCLANNMTFTYLGIKVGANMS
nr:RNA-directed DNA polymerase, eukaryota, reverse transcriptase zinc-binding domain protein [Tanacetum cinerariifolium]